MGAQSAILDAASFGLPSATAALVLFRFVDEVLDDEEVALQTSGSISQLLLIFLTMLNLKLERLSFQEWILADTLSSPCTMPPMWWPSICCQKSGQMLEEEAV